MTDTQQPSKPSNVSSILDEQINNVKSYDSRPPIEQLKQRLAKEKLDYNDLYTIWYQPFGRLYKIVCYGIKYAHTPGLWITFTKQKNNTIIKGLTNVTREVMKAIPISQTVTDINEQIKKPVSKKHPTTQQGWYEQGTYHLGNSVSHTGPLYGLNGTELWMWSAYDTEVKYHLHLKNIPLKNIEDKNYKKSKQYFYAKVSDNPNIYAYVSQGVGGAISFLGKGRWSGNAQDFGKDVKQFLSDIVVNGGSGYAISQDNIMKLMRRNFPGLEYIIRDGSIEVNWKKVEGMNERKDFDWDDTWPGYADDTGDANSNYNFKYTAQMNDTPQNRNNMDFLLKHGPNTDRTYDSYKFAWEEGDDYEHEDYVKDKIKEAIIKMLSEEFKTRKNK